MNCLDFVDNQQENKRMLSLEIEQMEQHLVASVELFPPRVPLAAVWKDMFPKEKPIYGEIDLKVIPTIERCWFVTAAHSLGFFLKYEYLATEFVHKSFFDKLDKLRPPNHQKSKENIHLPPVGIPNFTILHLLPSIYRAVELPPIVDFNAHLTELNRYMNSEVIYEVVDQIWPEQFMQGTVVGSYADWHCVQYLNNNNNIDLFIWSHPLTGLFRAPGWCCLIGHPLITTGSSSKSPVTYAPQASTQLSIVNSVQHFPDLELPFSGVNKFEIGKRVEALDPFLHKFHEAVVVDIYKHGYLVVEIRTDEDCKFKYCVHCTSKSLFPIGFCFDHNIARTDYDFGHEFDPVVGHCFTKYLANKNRFEEMMLVETFNLFGFGVLALGFIVRVVGRLIQIVMITSDQQTSSSTLVTKWVDFESPHLYPFGMSSLLAIPANISDKLWFLTNESLDWQIRRYTKLMNENFFIITLARLEQDQQCAIVLDGDEEESSIEDYESDNEEEEEEGEVTIRDNQLEVFQSDENSGESADSMTNVYYEDYQEELEEGEVVVEDGQVMMEQMVKTDMIDPDMMMNGEMVVEDIVQSMTSAVHNSQNNNVTENDEKSQILKSYENCQQQEALFLLNDSLAQLAENFQQQQQQNCQNGEEAQQEAKNSNFDL